MVETQPNCGVEQRERYELARAESGTGCHGNSPDEKGQTSEMHRRSVGLIS